MKELIVLLSLIAVAGCSGMESADTVESSVEDFYRQWFESMESKDVDSFLKLLDDDFYIKTPGQPAVSDTADLRKGLEQYHQAFDSFVDWEIDEIHTFDDHAVARLTESVTLISRQSSDTSQYEGVHLALLQKKNGTWRLKTDVSSMNQ